MIKIKIALIILALPTFWFVGKGGYELFCFMKRDQVTEAQVNHWEIKEINALFVPVAISVYEVNGVSYQTTTSLKTLSALNRPAAEEDLANYRTQKWQVWYDSKHPEDGSLEHLFPLKSILYGLITLGLFVYFCVIFVVNSSLLKENKK